MAIKCRWCKATFKGGANWAYYQLRSHCWHHHTDMARKVQKSLPPLPRREKESLCPRTVPKDILEVGAHRVRPVGDPDEEP